ncbi:M81 family metallopeptidase [Peristeroidobacter agariperforans]|uniref:M81 family metallopeptidase n=1 Tax=Peristeroidobacter agariperforans TaxID=268404 RepID=UPI00101CBDC7|nr:M81 family metallopeptidase [Peristeroidobacter agariperforans]
MRILTAAIVTETNTFSPQPTDWEQFQACGLCWREGDYIEETAFTAPVLLIKRLGERDGHEVVLGPSAYADPAGPTRRGVYESLREEILRRIETDGPFDAVLLTLHGAMVAEGYEDCEGDLLHKVRERVGATAFVGAMLDPHCHLTAAMVSAADAITIMKEYPHTDGEQRLRELYRICLRVLAGEIRPAAALIDCGLVGVWPTSHEPIRSLVDRISLRETHEPIVSIGFAHGFPWGDVPEAGARVLVLTNEALDVAESTAVAIADEIWSLRDFARIETVSVSEALSEVAVSRQGPVVLADIADNPGGGAPGDSTFILREALNRGLRDIAISLVHDPQSVDQCFDAGLGAPANLRIGGKHGRVSGEPLEVRATIRGLSERHSQQSPAEGPRIPLGRSAWVEIDGVHVILTHSRYQAVSPDVFSGLGLDPAALRAVIVKSTNHFRARFSAIADRILSVDTPGALSLDFANLPYQRRARNVWPRCDSRPEQTVVLRQLQPRRFIL